MRGRIKKIGIDYNNREELLKMLKISHHYNTNTHPILVKTFKDNFTDDIEVCAALAKCDADFMQFADAKILETKEDAKVILKEGGAALRFFSEEIKDDDETVLIAFKSDRSALEYMSPRLKKSKDFFLKCIAIQTVDLDYFDSSIFTEKAFAINAIRNSYKDFSVRGIKMVIDLYPSDRDIALESVKVNGLSIMHLAPLFQIDDEIVEEAINENCRALQYVPFKYKKYASAALKVLEKDKSSGAYYVSPQIMTDIEFLRKAVKVNYRILKQAKSYNETCEEFAMLALENDLTGVIPDAFYKDTPFLIKALDIKPEIMRWVSKKIADSKKFWLSAVVHSEANITHAAMFNPRKFATLEFCLEAIKVNSYVLYTILTINSMCKENHKSLLFADFETIDSEVAISIIKKNYKAALFIPNEILCEEEVYKLLKEKILKSEYYEALKEDFECEIALEVIEDLKAILEAHLPGEEE